MGLNSSHQFFYIKLVLRCFSKLSSFAIKGKLMNRTWVNGEKPNFWPNFGPFSPNLGSNFFSWVILLLVVRPCRKLLLYAISRKRHDPNSRKWQKPHCGPDLGHLGSNLGCLLFQKSGFVSHKIPWSVIIMYNMRKN